MDAADAVRAALGDRSSTINIQLSKHREGNGSADENFRLAHLQYKGRDFPEGHAEARLLYGLAAAQGHYDALCYLAGMFYNGEGGPVDRTEARRLFSLAAAGQGETHLMTHAQCLLGTMHLKGEGGPVDYREARRLFDLAASQGKADAQCLLAGMHHQGQGGPVDHAEARRMFKLSAAQGYANAQNFLGTMLLCGEGGPTDVAEARRLFGLAASQGHVKAQSAIEMLANAAATALLAEEEGGEASTFKGRSRKGKAQARYTPSSMLPEVVRPRHPVVATGSSRCSRIATTSQLSSPELLLGSAEAVSAIGGDEDLNRNAIASAASKAADEALRQAIAAEDSRMLSAALETNRAMASESVVLAARAANDKLKRRRRKQSQRDRRAQAGASHCEANAPIDPPLDPPLDLPLDPPLDPSPEVPQQDDYAVLSNLLDGLAGLDDEVVAHVAQPLAPDLSGADGIVGESRLVAEPTALVDLSNLSCAFEARNDDAATSVATALQCVVCMTRERAVACVPCGHKCLCNDCGKEEVVGESCPMCRKTVMFFMQVFE